MSLFDILGQVASGALGEQHFDQIAQSASPDLLGKGLSAMFQSDQTPAIGQLVGQLFGNSSGNQQAGMLNQILATLGPVAASALAGGALGRVLSPGTTQISPDQAAALSPSEVGQIVDQAQQAHPGIADALGSFYAQHSALIKTLGGAALAVVMVQLKDQVAGKG